MANATFYCWEDPWKPFLLSTSTEPTKSRSRSSTVKVEFYFFWEALRDGADGAIIATLFSCFCRPLLRCKLSF